MRNLVATTDVDKPVRHVYDQWTRLEELPDLMPGVTAVRQLDDASTHWEVVVRKERRTFGARITEQVPDHRIAWRSTDGTPHAGVVTFHRLDEHRTRVTVQLDWEPGGLFDRLGDRLGIVRREIQRDLDAFAAHVERQVVTPEGWRGTIGPRPEPAGPVAGATGDELPRGGATDDDTTPAAALGDGPERGRRADSPTDIPAGGWKDVLTRAWVQRREDNVSILAGGVAFYTFLALVPAIIATISIYGLVADPDDVEEQLESFLTALPEQAASLLQEQIESVAASGAAGLGLSALIAILGALWSASKGMQALVTALNIAYNEEETRGFLKLRGLALALTVGLAVAVAGAVAGMLLVGRAAEELGAAGELTATAIRWPVLGLLVIAGLAVIYRLAPDRQGAAWRWITPGAVVATVVSILATFGFSIYVSSFGSFNETYGSLAAVVILLLWLFLTSFIVIMGAEIDSEAERQTVRDSTTGATDPIGRREAMAADTVGNAAGRR